MAARGLAGALAARTLPERARPAAPAVPAAPRTDVRRTWARSGAELDRATRAADTTHTTGTAGGGER
ncbi:hypothetical protein [Streptomyces sp. NPDC058861]|uniref:hypothetical protein n=1 Tax=Streptomyces sp. NPDC058861 TaxID=3346653 RepID=UPI00368A24D3